MYCKSCLRQIKDDCIICPYCGKGRPQSRKLVETDDMPLGYSPKKNIIFVISVVTIIVLLIFLTFLPWESYKIFFHNLLHPAPESPVTSIGISEVAEIVEKKLNESDIQSTVSYDETRFLVNMTYEGLASIASHAIKHGGESLISWNAAMYSIRDLSNTITRTLSKTGYHDISVSIHLASDTDPDVYLALIRDGEVIYDIVEKSR